MRGQRRVFDDFSIEELNDIECRGLAWTTGTQAPVERNATAAEIAAYEDLAHAAYTLRKIKMRKAALLAETRKLRAHCPQQELMCEVCQQLAAELLKQFRLLLVDD